MDASLKSNMLDMIIMSDLLQGYIIVGIFDNHTEQDLSLYLELTCEEVILSPKQSIKLMAKKENGLLPITVSLVTGGLQIYANQIGDPDWYISFNDKIIKPSHPTRLLDYE